MSLVWFVGKSEKKTKGSRGTRLFSENAFLYMFWLLSGGKVQKDTFGQPRSLCLQPTEFDYCIFRTEPGIMAHNRELIEQTIEFVKKEVCCEILPIHLINHPSLLAMTHLMIGTI